MHMHVCTDTQTHVRKYLYVIYFKRDLELVGTGEPQTKDTILH